MNSFIKFTVVILIIAGIMRYLNSNYDDLVAGISERRTNHQEEVAQDREAVSTMTLATLTDPEILLFGHIDHDPQVAWEIRALGSQHAETFLDYATGGDVDWKLPAVRLLRFSTQPVWVNDITYISNETVGGLDVTNYSGRVIRGVESQSGLPPQIGKTIEFRSSAVIDWAITHEGLVYGLHTVRYLLEKRPQLLEDVDLKKLAPVPVPEDW